MAVNQRPIRLYRIGPLPKTTYHRDVGPMLSKWFKGNNSFYATGSPILAKTWRGMGEQFKNRSIYEITMRPDSKMLFFSRKAHYAKEWSSRYKDFFSRGSVGHIVRNRAELSYVPYSNLGRFGSAKKFAKSIERVAGIDPEQAQIVGRFKDIISYRKVPDVYKTLPKDISLRRMTTLGEHLRRHAKKFGRIQMQTEAIGKVIMKNTRARLIENKTTGLVNKVLHGNKINHTIQNATKKATSTINKSLRKAAKIFMR